MRRLTQFVATTAAAALVALAAGCTGTATPRRPGTPAPVAPVSQSAAGAGAGGTAAPAPPVPADAGRTAGSAACDGHGVPVNGLLRAVRTGHHPTFDRVVVEFCGSGVPAYRLGYVDTVRQDPSDRPVAMRGAAFVRIAFRGATTDTAGIAPDPHAAPRYTGPRRLTPDLPLVRDVAIVGDFERVLSLGIGLARPAGVHVRRLAAPPRLVVDFWTGAPSTLLWPARTTAQAQDLQRAADQGHQPWLLPGSPPTTTAAYARLVLGWQHADVRRIGAAVYQAARPDTGETAVLTLVQPVRRGPGGLWVVADVAR